MDDRETPQAPQRVIRLARDPPVPVLFSPRPLPRPSREDVPRLNLPNRQTRAADHNEVFLLMALIGANTILLGMGVGMIAVGGSMVTLYNQYSNTLTNIYLVLYLSEAIAMLVFGFLTLLVVVIGYALLCIPSRNGFIVLAVLAMLLLLTIVVLLIVYAAIRTGTYTQLNTAWTQNLASFFTDVASTSVVSTTTIQSYAYLWNQLMFNLNCCGVSSYSDYYTASRWSRSYSTYSVTSAIIPIWCCKMASGTQFPIQQPSDSSCLTSPTTSNSYSVTSCANALLTAVQDSQYATVSIVLAVVAIVMLLILFIAAIIALHNEITEPFVVQVCANNCYESCPSCCGEMNRCADCCEQKAATATSRRIIWSPRSRVEPDPVSYSSSYSQRQFYGNQGDVVYLE